MSRPILRSACSAVLMLSLQFGGWPSASVANEIAGEGELCIECQSEPCDACGCANACDCDCECKDRLFGFILPTDTCYSDFISPMTNPVYFEDPRNLSEARFIFAHHTLPDRAPLAGGSVNVLALQLRAKVTERLSIIATKDGFITANGASPQQDGWADVNLGVKYLLFADPQTQRLLSTGLTFGLPVGSTRALQGIGDGEFNLFLTGGTQFWDSWHYVSATGIRIPSDRQEQNQVWYWSNHWDKQIACSKWYALTEVNWYHYLNGGDGPITGINGLDLYNLGSDGVAGHDIVTWAIGLKYKPTTLSELGVAYEIPVTDDRDLLQNRFTFDAIIRY